MFKLSISYPTKEEERQILDRMAITGQATKASTVIHPDDIMRLRALVDEIYVDDKIKDYIVDLVFATREPQQYKLELDKFIQYGASPRATLFLTLASKAHALLQGRGYVTPQDVKSIGADILRHRVIVTYEAEAEDVTPDSIIKSLFDGVPVP
jgi:MoxR-like ATPase